MNKDATPSRSPAMGLWILALAVMIAAGAGLVYLNSKPTVDDANPVVNEPELVDGLTPAELDLAALQSTFNATLKGGKKPELNRVLKAAEKFAQEHPDMAEAHSHLALVIFEIRENERDLQRAYEEMNLGLRIHEDKPQVSRKLEAEMRKFAGNTAMDLEDIDNAARHYRRLIDLDAQNAHDRLYLANLYFLQKRYDEATQLALESLSIDSSLHMAHSLLSEIYAAQGKHTLALVQIQHAIDKAGPFSERPLIVKFVRRKAMLQRRANHFDEALMTLQAELEVDERRDVAVIREMAMSWGMMGFPQEAADLYERAWRQQPFNMTLLTAAAEWRIKAGQFDEAEQRIDDLRRRNPNLPAIADLRTQIAAERSKPRSGGDVLPLHEGLDHLRDALDDRTSAPPADSSDESDAGDDLDAAGADTDVDLEASAATAAP